MKPTLFVLSFKRLKMLILYFIGAPWQFNSHHSNNQMTITLWIYSYQLQFKVYFLFKQLCSFYLWFKQTSEEEIRRKSGRKIFTRIFLKFTFNPLWTFLVCFAFLLILDEIKPIKVYFFEVFKLKSKIQCRSYTQSNQELTKIHKKY